MLKLFYITNNPDVAKIAQDCGVDRIFVDMEYIGKELRQPNMDTVKNHHTTDDVVNVRRVLDKAELLVRVNPIHDDSKNEIESVIAAGADVVMLPMWKSAKEVSEFISLINKRAKTLLLLETDEAVECLDEVLELQGIDEIHIGLNDLHLSQHKRFLFELLTDGTVEDIAGKIKKKHIPFGIGGIGAVGSKVQLPAENIIAEHYRLGSCMAILSRAFCNTSEITDLDEIRNTFGIRLNANKAFEKSLLNKDEEYFNSIHEETRIIIKSIVGD